MTVDKDINITGAPETLACKLKRQSYFRLFCLTYISHSNVHKAAYNTAAGSFAT